MSDLAKSIKAAFAVYSALLTACVFPLLLVVEPFLGFWADWLLATAISITSIAVMFSVHKTPRSIKALWYMGLLGIALLTVNGLVSSALASYISPGEKNLETAIRLGAYLAHVGSVLLLHGLFLVRLTHALKEEMRDRTNTLCQKSTQPQAHQKQNTKE